MPRFAYPCPGCRTTNSLHDAGCDFEGTEWHHVEQAYTDVLTVLLDGPVTESALQHAVHGEWSGLHRAALDLLRREGRVDDWNRSQRAFGETELEP